MKPCLHILIGLPLLLMVTACVAQPSTPSGEQRPMDEVPVQMRLPDGSRQYSFRNGCIIVIEAKRAIVTSEATVCELYHRDIALLYAAGD
ncbi:hypothetical protein P6U16_05815 [Rhizobium sp. 32-5/1]|uniref:hypothetical protein n=1 Tax=Rhizobium sp. 32-5/1 TaxID=3019602 RepID=UPI00240E6066|nr:hypothetical protein [Rhizobium sp. 32-5/1]WEZ84197.1 hypothetical protein P6U16_05815 [Rhizobium sp. 32-5/1]